MMLSILKWLAIFVVAYAALVVVARLVFPLPPLDQRKTSAAIPLSDGTALGRLTKAGMAAFPGKTGVLPIPDGKAALLSRILLADRAEASIDAQYYIWHDDTAGRLMLRELYRAARRGVRVRLLLDDNGISGLDATLAALNAVDNIEIRLFNPSTIRRPKVAGYAFDFFRMNRRMHNKAFIVDGAVAIVGGRNIGDEYFQIHDAGFFIDLDVLAAGAVVADTAAVFDRYWNSASAHPIETIVKAGGATLPRYITGGEEIGSESERNRLAEAAQTEVARFARGEVGLEWVDAEVIADDPAKGLGEAKGDQLMISRLAKIAGEVRKKLDLISAYFIPGNRGVEFFTGLQRAGAHLRILTNAFHTTDVKMVHAGYAKYRRALLEAGIELYEMMPVPGVAEDGKTRLIGGSSRASLHAKTLAIDDAAVFIGSFNLDPRSALLNCEMGFLIDSPAIASQISASFPQIIEKAAYRVRLNDGAMEWIEQKPDGGEIVHTTEPGMSLVDRVLVRVMGWLPIEWLL